MVRIRPGEPLSYLVVFLIMQIKNQIIQKLQNSLSPEKIEVIDESHKHQGHAGNHLSSQSHFILKISAKIFDNKTKLESHKLIHNILKQEISQIHSLVIKIS